MQGRGRDTGYKTKDAVYRIKDKGYKIQDTGYIYCTDTETSYRIQTLDRE